jgi:hypothetical protein
MRRSLQFAALLALICAPAWAQTLVDPMRPATAAAPEEAESSAKAGPVLEQILESKGRRFAVISGQRLGIGEKLGDARLVDIGLGEVTLKGPNGTEVLGMFPDARKTSHAGGQPAPRRRMAETKP